MLAVLRREEIDSTNLTWAMVCKGIFAEPVTVEMRRRKDKEKDILSGLCVVELMME